MIMLLQQRQAPSNIMNLKAAEDERRTADKPCTCGSGKKYGECHGDNSPVSQFSGIASVKASILVAD
jgi:hypothetical protein